MPSSRQAHIMRVAISPRLATRIFLNISSYRSATGCFQARSELPTVRSHVTPAKVERRGPGASGSNPEQGLIVFDGHAIFSIDLLYRASYLSLDFIHELHRLDNAYHRVGSDGGAHLHIRIGIRRRRTVESADNRRLYHMQNRF